MVEMANVCGNGNYASSECAAAITGLQVAQALESSTPNFDHYWDQITTPANSPIDRLAMSRAQTDDLVTSVPQKIYDRATKTTRLTTETINYRKQALGFADDTSEYADLVQIDSPAIRGASNIMEAGTASQLKSAGGKAWWDGLSPHNVYQNMCTKNANCLDTALVAQDFLATQGVQSNVVAINRTTFGLIPHYAISIPSEQTIVRYGGQVLTKSQQMAWWATR